jgi:hypothetical protein
MSYDELIACRRRHLNTHYSGKRGKGDAFDHAKGNINAADVLLDWRVERIVCSVRTSPLLRLPRPAFSGGDKHLWTPLLNLSASFWHQSVVERAAKRTTRSTTSAAVPTGRNGFDWIPKEWTFHSDAVWLDLICRTGERIRNGSETQSNERTSLAYSGRKERTGGSR